MPSFPTWSAVSYVTDPERWHFLLQIPGLCRVMFPVAADESDEQALSPEFAQSLMAAVVPGISRYEIAHVTLYKVHQRVAKTFQHGRAFLAGDAAHINNPLGGMGMNGGIHDAINLTSRMVDVWHETTADAELEGYDRQRRLVTLEYIEKQSIQNKRNLESDGTEFRRALTEIAAEKAEAYALPAAGLHDREPAPRAGAWMKRAGRYPPAGERRCAMSFKRNWRTPP